MSSNPATTNSIPRVIEATKSLSFMWRSTRTKSLRKWYVGYLAVFLMSFCIHLILEKVISYELQYADGHKHLGIEVVRWSPHPSAQRCCKLLDYPSSGVPVAVPSHWRTPLRL